MKLFATMVIALLLIGSAISIPEERVRVLATEGQFAQAMEGGCQEVHNLKSAYALWCPPGIAKKLGLQEDPKVFASDDAANKAVSANRVQSSGNVGVGRKIVVLDSGYDYTHRELDLSYLGGYDFVNSDNDPMDDNGHGSHVAGIITADGYVAQARGVAPGAGIVAGKVLNAQGTGYLSDVVAGIYWAVDGPDRIANTADDFKADAISISIETAAPYTFAGYCDDAMPVMTEAARYATSRGVIVIASAGNNGGSGISLPGCISHVFTVGAVDAKGKAATFTGKGSSIDVCAPGVNLYSVGLDGNYVYRTGTSMATPVVSGTVALMKSAHPEYTPAQIKAKLLSTATDLSRSGWDNACGEGKIDASLAAK
jgi:subtilisin family serine protease